MSAPAVPVFEQAFRVRAGEAGPAGTLHVAALGDWLQDAAASHAAALALGGAELRARGLAWVLSRLSVRVDALPALGEEARVVTWPSGARRLWALREFRVTGGDGRLFALATSGWLVVRLDGKKPARPLPEVLALAPLAPSRALDDPFDDLEPPGDGASEGPRARIGRSSLDANAHANNVVLLRLLVDALPEAPTLPLALSVEFRGEALEGDVVAARVANDANGVRLALVAAGSGREIARARFS